MCCCVLLLFVEVTLLAGVELLRNPRYNKGMSFTDDERDKMHLRVGLSLPGGTRSILVHGPGTCGVSPHYWYMGCHSTLVVHGLSLHTVLLLLGCHSTLLVQDHTGCHHRVCFDCTK